MRVFASCRGIGVIAGSCAALTVFLAQGCSVEKPVAPKWDTTLAVPLIDKTFTVRELIEDEENLYVDGEGVVNFSVEKTLDRYYVGEKLKVKGIEKELSASVGSFEINAPDTVSITVTLGEIFPPSRDIPPGQTTVIPAFTFESEPKEADRFKTFQYVKLESGWLEVTVVNDLPITLGSPPEHPLTAKIWAESPTGEPLEVVEYSQSVPAYSQRSQVIDLSGHYLPNQFYIVVAGGSPGSEGQEVEVNPDWGFSLRIFFHDLRVEEAVAKVPEQEIQREDSFPIKDTLAIQEARIKRGSIRVQFWNSLPIGAVVSYELPDFQQFDQPLRGEFDLAPQAYSDEVIDLSGVMLRTAKGGKAGEQELRFHWNFRTESTGETMIHLSKEDSVRARITTDEIVFSEITGELGRVQVDFEPMARNFKVPKQIDSLNFQAVNLDLSLNHTLEFPARAHIVIEGMNDDGRVAQLVLEPQLDPAPAEGSRTDHFVINQDYPGLREFLGILPSSILVNGYVEIGAPGWVATVKATDWVEGAVAISAPVAVSIPEQTTRSKVDSLKSSAEDRKDALDFLRQVRLVAEVENRLPVGASVQLKFAREDSLVFDEPDVIVGPITLEAALASNQGQMAKPASSTIELSLDEAQLDFFRLDPIFTGIEVYLPGTNGQVAVLRAEDYLRVRAYLQVQVLVHQPEDAGD